MSRADALSEQQEDTIWELWLRRIPQAVIARHVGCSRQAVNAAVARTRKALNAERLAELEEIRAEVLAEYDVIKQECWRRLAECGPASTAGVGLISAILDARRQENRVLGLETLTVNHRAAAIVRLEAMLNEGVPIVLPGGDGSE